MEEVDPLEEKNSAAKTVSLVMAVTLIGKVLGLYRDRLLAVHYSTGPAANAFFTASRIPRARRSNILVTRTTLLDRAASE